MLEVAGTRPHDLGLPFTGWSLRKLATHLVRCGVVKELHATTLGRILRDQGFSFQRTKTWRVICFDEFGPIEVRPYHGRAWRIGGSMARANISRPTTSRPIDS